MKIKMESLLVGQNFMFFKGGKGAKPWITMNIIHLDMKSLHVDNLSIEAIQKDMLIVLEQKLCST